MGEVFEGIDVALASWMAKQPVWRPIAHVRGNGRVCLLFASFDRRPRIVRLHGRGTVALSGSPAYDEVVARHPAHPGTRAVRGHGFLPGTEECREHRRTAGPVIVQGRDHEQAPGVGIQHAEHDRDQSLSRVTVLVTGVPGSGKTSLARDLAPVLHLPLLSMDFVKESLFGSLGVRDRSWSLQLRAAALEVIWSLLRDCPDGAVIDVWLNPSRDLGRGAHGCSEPVINRSPPP